MSEPMTFEKLQTVVTEMVQKQYRDNGDADFDLMPTAYLILEDGSLTIAAIAGLPPHIGLPFILEKTKPVMYGFASASWMTQADKEGNKIGERREGVIMTFETKEEMIMMTAEVTRAPLPVLGEIQRGEAGTGRLSHLLCRPEKNRMN